MLLEFPSLETLALMLKAGLIPAAVATAPCKAWQDGERWLVSTPAALGKATVAALKTWKVAAKNRGVVPQDAADFALLAQVIPLARDAGKIEVTDRLAVIFWLPSAALLEPFVQEILRQGNDRIALRSLSDSDGGEQVLMRVIGPPYYSLLQALEPDAAAPIRAYVERAPRVWVELGYSHPLANQMQPAAGQWLLLTAPRAWQTIGEAPFRDLYTQLDLQLPYAAVELEEIEPPKLNVPLRLVRGGGYESPELYVLRERAIEQLDAFVQSTSDQTIARLSFAVVEQGPEPWVILRVRPGKEKEPLELVFDGLACRSYLRIANLFVPSGVRLHPPLRRDAVKDLLAADAQQIVWLQPLPNGEFQPQSLPESAFHPLSRWVEYILDREREPLTAWIRSTTFDFDDFICRDDVPEPRPREREAPTSNLPAAPPSAKSTGAPAKSAEPKPAEKPAVKLKAPEPTPKTPTQMQRQLRELETRFLDLKTPFDSPERAKLWQEMALLHSVIGHHADASLCFAHVLWEEGADSHWAAVEEWLLNETKATALGWTDALRELTTKKAIGALSRLIDLERPLAQHGQIVAAFLSNWLQTAKHTVAPATAARLQAYLEKVEPMMPVRIAWLAWHALYRLSSDELMLARARDRILQRLHQQGLMADLELPLFLRSTGPKADQHRTVRDELAQLHGLAHAWSDRNRGATSPKTKDYIDLIFAFGFARLGEGVKARELLRSAHDSLHAGVVHRLLCAGYEYRVGQVLDGQPPSGPLPARLMKELAALPLHGEDNRRYKIDRLRERSRILEPHEALNAYRHINQEELAARLAELPDILDANIVQRRLGEHWRAAESPQQRCDVLLAAFQTAWRLGEPLTVEMLARVPGVLATNDVAPEERLKLLQLALLSAAHYDLRADVSSLLAELSKWLTPASLKNEKVLNNLEQTLALIFQRLRKMGLREAIESLLRHATSSLRGALSRGSGTPNELRMLLCLGGAALMLGEASAWSDIDRARQRLLTQALAHEGDTGVQKQTQLSVAYLRAVGQGPLAIAIERFKEYFEQTSGMRETTIVADSYSLKQLEVVETLVLLMTSDNFAMDRAARAWLDDEEFLIRRRIHADVRAALV